MTSLIIHAGLHKTGTSAIQSFLHENRGLLLRNGFFYPPTEPFQAHHKFVSRLVKACDGNMEEAINDVNRTLTTYRDLSNESSVIVSSEMFCEGVDPLSLKHVNDIFEKVEVVFYVRPQSELMESAYNQQVKQNMEPRKIYEYVPYMKNIYKHIRWYEEALPKSRIRVFPYKPSKLFNNDVISDFCSKVLNLKSSEFNWPPQLVNKSLSPISCMILSICNANPLTANVDKSELLRIFHEYFPSQAYRGYKLMPNEMESALISETLSSNELLDERYLESKFMSLQKLRDKVVVTPELALAMAEESGLMNILNSKFGIKI